MRSPLLKKISLFLAGILPIAVIAYLLIPEVKTFPIIGEGYLSGTISGIAPRPENTYSLFLEKVKDKDELIAIVFIQNWEPQVISLELDESAKAPALLPLRIDYAESTYSLTGSQKGKGYAGLVRSKGRKVGRWTIQSADLAPPQGHQAKNMQLSKWLQLKGKYYSLQEQYKQILDEVKIHSAEVTLLSKILESKDELEDAASNEIQTLGTKLKEKKVEKAKLVKNVEDRARSLEQLTRITRRGRTIELARRVAKRENKWYLVNWGDSSNAAISEEELAERMNVDIRKLSGKLSQSEEYLKLKGSIAVERRKIRELQNMINERQQMKEERQIQKQKGPRRPETPWWEKWDTLFG